MERALVTGGAGFIGSNLVDRLLAHGTRVVALDDLSTGRLANLDQARRLGEGRFVFQRLNLVDGGVDALVAKHRPEVIFHLAAQVNVRRSVEDPVHDARVNLIGTVRLLEAARRHGVGKVVFATSGGTIYGEPDELPVTEEHPLGAKSPYAASKLAAEEYLRVFSALYGLRWASLALANVYGPRQDPVGEAGVVAIFAERMLGGEPVVIYGDGEQTRDFVFVDDVVHAFVLAAEPGHDQRFNIGTGQQTSVNRLFRAMAEATDYGGEPVYAAERPGELRHSAVDPSRAGQQLGWSPWTSLAEGLAATLDWTRGH